LPRQKIAILRLHWNSLRVFAREVASFHTFEAPMVSALASPAQVATEATRTPSDTVPLTAFAATSRRWLKANAIVIFAYLGFFAAWELANTLFRVPQFLLPSPTAIIARAADNPARLAFHLSTILQEVLLGFLLGVVVSIPLGILIVCSRHLERIVYPLLVAFQAIPKVALAPILVVWFGFGPTSKVMLGFVTALFPIVINTVVGMNQTPREMLYLMRSLGASPLQTFLLIRIFTAAPFIFAGFKVGVTLAVVGAVVGEFIASNCGLGYLLLVANNSFDTPLLFAIVVLLSLMSVALFYAIELIEVLLLPRPLRRKGGDVNPGASS
jgi:NitT/TauT family transport system permease protein